MQLGRLLSPVPLSWTFLDLYSAIFSNTVSFDISKCYLNLFLNATFSLKMLRSIVLGRNLAPTVFLVGAEKVYSRNILWQILAIVFFVKLNTFVFVFALVYIKYQIQKINTK